MPKEPAMIVMSVPSEKPSLLMSAGQALRPQCIIGLVPAEVSRLELKPSQSGSLGGTGQGGRFCVAFGQLMQLSPTSGTPSPSLSPPGVSDGVNAGVAVSVGVGVGVSVAEGVVVGVSVGVPDVVGVSFVVGVEVGDAVGAAPLAVVKFTTSTPLFVLPRGSSQSARKNRRW